MSQNFIKFQPKISMILQTSFQNKWNIFWYDLFHTSSASNYLPYYRKMNLPGHSSGLFSWTFSHSLQHRRQMVVELCQPGNRGLKTNEEVTSIKKNGYTCHFYKWRQVLRNPHSFFEENAPSKMWSTLIGKIEEHILSNQTRPLLTREGVGVCKTVLVRAASLASEFIPCNS